MINPGDMQNPLVIRLVSQELDLSNIIQSTFWHNTTTMNPINIVKFFHIIYNIIFISQTKKGLLRLISNYFTTIEINSHRILHLYYFI